MNILQECNRSFEKHQGLNSSLCNFCKWYPSKDKKAKCKECYLEGCINCIEEILEIRIIEPKQKEENN